MPVLTARERVVVTAIAQALFSSGEPVGPGETAAGIASYIDTLLARVALAKRIRLRALLMTIEVGTAIQRRGVLFSAAALDERVARLRAWERSDRYPVRAQFSTLRRIFTLGYLAEPVVQQRIGLPQAFRGHPRNSGVRPTGIDFRLPSGSRDSSAISQPITS